MNDKTTIPKTKINAVMLRYAELGNFTQVAREFGYPSYVVTRCWKNLSQNQKDDYQTKVSIITDKLTQKCVQENTEHVVTYMERILNIRNKLLEKLEALTNDIKTEDPKSIYLLKESANTLKTITSIAEVSDENSTQNKLDELISKITKDSTLHN